MDIMEKPVTSGLVAIVGPPNAGKSTLLNYLLGQKISIVTPKPQTTRNRIVGIVNDDNYQVVFLDTPGLHKSREPLNVEMVKIAMDSLSDVDLVLFLVDVSLPLPQKVQDKKDEEIRGYLEQVKSPAIMVLNKIDLIDKKKYFPSLMPIQNCFPLKR